MHETEMRDLIAAELRDHGVNDPDRVAAAVFMELSMKAAVGDARYLRWCEWPGCLRSFHALTGPKREIDGEGWVRVPNGNSSLFCPDHAATGHQPQRPEWQPGWDYMHVSCECGARQDGRQPSTLESNNAWWRDHVSAASPPSRPVDATGDTAPPASDLQAAPDLAAPEDTTRAWRTIKVTVTPAVVLRHAIELTEPREGEDRWERQARGLDKLGYALMGKAAPSGPGGTEHDPAAIERATEAIYESCTRDSRKWRERDETERDRWRGKARLVIDTYLGCPSSVEESPGER